MPMMQFTGSLAAGATLPNVLAGSTFEFLSYDAAVQFAVIGSAAGLVATVQSGADVLMEESPISTANRFGIFPDDFPLSDVAAGGERLKVLLRNTSAGALTYFVTVRVDQL
jgi:hypothetical protein